MSERLGDVAEKICSIAEFQCGLMVKVGVPLAVITTLGLVCSVPALAAGGIAVLAGASAGTAKIAAAAGAAVGLWQVYRRSCCNERD